jgi:aldose 1-epimerase
MPFGLGWHPYFHLAETTGATYMKLPAVIQYELDSLSIPTGLTSENTDFNNFASLNGQSLDDCFNSSNGEPAIIKYADGDLLEIYRDDTFPYLQIYTPDDHKSVAIEPMTCGVNAWNIDHPIPTLKSREVFKGNMGVRLIKAK